jgi:DNA mismatch endonuclease (patch repair protein)
MARSLSLGRGQRVPYPEPTSPAATAIGRANRRSGTRAETELRKILHGLGLRYRTDHLIRAGGLRTHADLAFTSVSLAVFVDGCFWHCCPEHFCMPRSNLDYWRPKLAANVARDRRVDAALRDSGWSVLRVWEHQPAKDAAEGVLRALAGVGHDPAMRALSRMGLRDSSDPGR